MATQHFPVATPREWVDVWMTIYCCYSILVYHQVACKDNVIWPRSSKDENTVNSAWLGHREFQDWAILLDALPIGYHPFYSESEAMWPHQCLPPNSNSRICWRHTQCRLWMSRSQSCVWSIVWCGMTVLQLGAWPAVTLPADSAKYTPLLLATGSGSSESGPADLRCQAPKPRPIEVISTTTGPSSRTPSALRKCTPQTS